MRVKTCFAWYEMETESRLKLVLFLLRISVFSVMLVWILDKFINPVHAAAVYEKLYFIPGLAGNVMAVLGGLELVLIMAFLLGILKFWTTPGGLVIHGISTLSS